MFVDHLDPRGFYHIEHERDGVVLDAFDIHNGITNVGRNGMLDAFFNVGSQASTFYIGIVDTNSFTAFSAADTSAAHSGWIEFDDYNGTLRGVWGQGAASGQTVTNGSVLTFTFNATGVIQGIFVITDGTKGGNIGLLWSTASFNTTLNVQSGDILRVTYTVTI